MIHWKRREHGSYVATVNGTRYAIVNMKQGANAPKWQGPIPAWEVRRGGDGDYDIGSTKLTTYWTLAEAKAAVEKEDR
jgi:hypothetical protein